MSRNRPASSTRQQLPGHGQLYAIRVLFTLMALVMLALGDTACRSQPGAHLWLLLAGGLYPHAAHLLLGRFGGRRAQTILVIDGLFAGAIIGAIGLLSAPGAVLAAINLFNWAIMGGPLLVVMGMLATLVGVAITGFGAQTPFPIGPGDCASLDALAAGVLLGYFFVIARFMSGFIVELRVQQTNLQATADVADGARAIADRALLGVLPASAAEILAETGDLPTSAVDNATLLLIEFAWSRGESPAVAELAECFHVCETILSRHGLEGIKTFGRRYFALCRAATGPDDAVKAARELSNYLHNHRVLMNMPTAQRSFRATLHCGTVTVGLVQPERLNLDVSGEAAEALYALAGMAAKQPMATVVASSAALRRLQDAADFVTTPGGDAGAELHVLSLATRP